MNRRKTKLIHGTTEQMNKLRPGGEEFVKFAQTMEACLRVQEVSVLEQLDCSRQTQRSARLAQSPGSRKLVREFRKGELILR